jgi:hypothetical protein
MPIRAQATGSQISPHLASGRPRVERLQPRHQWAAPHDARSAPASDGRGPMTSLRRRPREVYRVYDEDEFLRTAVAEELFESLPARSSERRLSRLACAAMLAGTVGTVGGVIAVNSLRSAGGKGAAARGAAHPAAHPYLARQRASAMRISVAARTSISWGQRRLGGHGDGAQRSQADTTRAKTGVDRYAVTALAARSMAVARPITAERSVAVARSVASASSAPSLAKSVEFGFER